MFYARADEDVCTAALLLDVDPGGEPLRRVHECVFGVLAMESEPVDPRL